MKIPLIRADLPPFDAVKDSLQEILENGKVTNFGKYVTQFEQETAAYLGTQTATVSSGTMALLFTLQAMGLQPGQKVIVPSFSFMATAQAVFYAGGTPVFAEVGEDLNISSEDLQGLLRRHPDTAMVVGVHLYGLPCRVQRIQQVVEEVQKKLGRPIPVVYDAAHAFGAAIGNQRVGAFGAAEVFSLSVTKALVCVEGGLVSSKDAQLIQRIRKMRNYGVEENYNAHWPGLNGKMSEFHAIVGIHNLRNLDSVLETRARKAAYYARQIEMKTSFRTLHVPKEVTHTFKDLTILVPAALKGKRDRIMQSLSEQEVETRAYFYPPIHEQKFFSRFADRALPVTEDLSRRVITLPFFTSITEEQMDTVAEALQKAERSLA